MLNLEENMTNLKNTWTRVKVGDRRTLTGTKVVTGTAGRNVTENYI